MILARLLVLLAVAVGALYLWSEVYSYREKGPDLDTAPEALTVPNLPRAPVAPMMVTAVSAMSLGEECYYGSVNWPARPLAGGGGYVCDPADGPQRQANTRPPVYTRWLK
jgi:hypothetical protein